MEAKLE